MKGLRRLTVVMFNAVSLQDVVDRLVVEAWRQCGCNVSATARLLGCDRNTVSTRIRATGARDSDTPSPMRRRRQPSP